MKKDFILKLDRKQARILERLIDGLVDAGSCAGGMTDEELAACKHYLIHYRYYLENK